VADDSNTPFGLSNMLLLDRLRFQSSRVRFNGRASRFRCTQSFASATCCIA